MAAAPVSERSRHKKGSSGRQERADTGTAPVSSEAREKVENGSYFAVNLRRPFLEDLGRSRHKKDSSAWKK